MFGRSWRGGVLATAVALTVAALSCATGKAPPTCDPGKSLCSGVCVDLQADPDNCGKCESACPVAQVCGAGKCATECPSGNSACTVDGGAHAYCVDLQSDNANCGTCGKACSAGQACVKGTCSSECASNSTLCTPDAGGGSYCANLKTDNQNCGACGQPCPTGLLCTNGACAGACTSTQTKCTPDAGPAYCADLQTDNANCGTCGKACGVLEVCAAGQCSSECGPQQTVCTPDAGQPYCANTFSDNKNCGTCGNVCPSNKPVCSGGTCSDGSCNRNVLVLGDGDTASNNALQTAFQNAGFTVTMQTSGTTTYTGTPDAATFGVVWVGPGLTYSTDMPAGGQTSIVNAHNNTSTKTGVIFEEWSGFEVYGGRYQTLKQITLITYVGYAMAPIQYTLVQSGHPIWNGLPTSFTTSTSIACTVISSLGNGGTTLASSTGCGIGVAVANPSTLGRVVDFAQAGAYSSATWYNDANTVKMVANAALWAARCD